MSSWYPEFPDQPESLPNFEIVHSAMNWATIAPETRIYKGKNLYRWEDSPGLGRC
jgi:hypothetical protein